VKLQRLIFATIGVGIVLVSSSMILHAQQPKTLPKKITPQQAPKPQQAPPKKQIISPLELPRPKPGEIQRPEMPSAPVEPKGKDDDYLYPWGRLATRRTTPQGVILALQGDAHLLFKESKFLSDVVYYNQDTEIGSAPGKVKLDDAQNTLTSDKGSIYYAKNKKEALLEGDVVIIARPKQSETSDPKSLRKDFKSPVTITCDKANYQWKLKHGWSNTNVKISCRIRETNWNFVTDQMDYFGKEERVVLKCNVVGKSEKGEVLFVNEATILLTEGKEAIDAAPIKPGTTIKIDKDDDEEKPAGAKPSDAKPIVP
jgi:lipopolysaccharide export system protein LptA